MKYKNDNGTNLAGYQVKNIAAMARNRLIQINSLCASNENDASTSERVISAIFKHFHSANEDDAD